MNRACKGIASGNGVTGGRQLAPGQNMTLSGVAEIVDDNFADIIPRDHTFVFLSEFSNKRIDYDKYSLKLYTL
jgi:hypothetical protein